MPSFNAYRLAVEAKTKEEADVALKELIRTVLQDRPGLDYAEARAIQLANIGYFFGYLSRVDILRALELYPEAVHPIFGRDFDDLPPEIIFKAGKVMGEAMANQPTDEAIQLGRKVVEDYRNSLK